MDTIPNHSKAEIIVQLNKTCLWDQGCSSGWTLRNLVWVNDGWDIVQLAYSAPSPRKVAFRTSKNFTNREVQLDAVLASTWWTDISVQRPLFRELPALPTMRDYCTTVLLLIFIVYESLLQRSIPKPSNWSSQKQVTTQGQNENASNTLWFGCWLLPVLVIWRTIFEFHPREVGPTSAHKLSFRFIQSELSKFL